MPAFLAQIGVTVGGVLVSMLGQLVTEQFLKHLTVHALTVITKRTPTDVDDQILADAKKAWGID